MGVLDNGREWSCSIDIYDLKFGNPASDNSVNVDTPVNFTNANIKKWKITDNMTTNGDIAFGSVGSKALSLELLGLASKSFGTGAIIGVTLTLVGGSSNSMFFFADKVAWTADFGTTTTYSCKIDAYDAMYFASTKVKSLLNYGGLPSTIEGMIQVGSATISNCKTIVQYCIRHARYDQIRTRADELYTETGDTKYQTYANMFDSTDDVGYSSGKTMDDVCSTNVGKATVGTLSGYTGSITLTDGLTGRTLLSRMAAMAGLRCYCNNNSLGNIASIVFGKLIGAEYNGGVALGTKDVYGNGFVQEGKKKITYFVSGTSSAPATAGKQTSSGYSTMSIDCPDMTTSHLTSLANTFMSSSEYGEYEIGSVKFRGDPSLTAGMRMTVPDAGGNNHSIIASKVVTNYDGGLYQQITADGKSDADIQFSDNRFAEQAEEIVDDGGGGGGGSSLIHYSETANSATISVNSNSIVTDNSGIAITGNTSVTGDLSVTGDITCGGTMTYDILSANGLIVSGGASIGGNISTGDGSVIAMSKSTSLGTYYGSITATKLEGHDILLSTPRLKTVGAHTYQAFNKIAVCTYDPSLVYPGIPSQSEANYGAAPVIYLRQGREKDGSIDEGTIGSLLGTSTLRFYDREKTITNEYGTYTIPAGGFSIGYNYDGTNYSSAVIKFTFYDYQNTLAGTYNITMANIAALANLT